MELKGSRCVRLSDGHLMPVLGLGTYASEHVPKRKAYEATKVAIDIGYRHFDSAYYYQNEEEVGAAMREKVVNGIVRREDLFYTTKVWSTFLQPDLVRPSLKKLKLDYVDLFLIHLLVALKPGEEILPKDGAGKVMHVPVDLCETWEALERYKDVGLTRSIGVSNFNRRQLEMILMKPGLKYKPVCNQVECHPYLNQHKLLNFCNSNDIVLVAYSALGSQRDLRCVPKESQYLLEDPVLKAIAKKYNHSPRQVALHYQLQRGVVVLAKSFNEKGIQENFQVYDFDLTLEDMKSIDGINRDFLYWHMKMDAIYKTTKVVYNITWEQSSTREDTTTTLTLIYSKKTSLNTQKS